MATATSPRINVEHRHRESNPALWDETPASSPADSDGMAESEGVEPSSVTSPSLFSGQVAVHTAALSLAEGERIERPRAVARPAVSNRAPYLSGNLPDGRLGRLASYSATQRAAARSLLTTSRT